MLSSRPAPSLPQMSLFYLCAYLICAQSNNVSSLPVDTPSKTGNLNRFTFGMSENLTYSPSHIILRHVMDHPYHESMH